jgi:hypothetical protein
VTFLRLNRWDWLAFVLALALLFVMSLLWYSTVQGDQCRQAGTLAPASGVNGTAARSAVQRSARECEAKYDKTAWQASGGIDRVILIVLLAAIVSAVAAAFLRAADRRFQPPLTPSAVAAGLALVGALLVLYRILQPPGFNPSAVVKAGAPIGLVCVGLLAIAARGAVMAERERPAEPSTADASSEPTETAPGEEAAPAVPPDPPVSGEPEATPG